MTAKEIEREETAAEKRKVAVYEATIMAARTGKPAIAYAERGTIVKINPDGSLTTSSGYLGNKEDLMAAQKTNDVETKIERLEARVKDQAGQIKQILARLDELETETKEVVTKIETGRAKRVYTDDERAAIGVRLQTARAKKLGLTLDELRFLKLRPGVKPPAADIKRAKAAVGAAEVVGEALSGKQGAKTKKASK
jgi:seryl-tRNA synthetase